MRNNPAYQTCPFCHDRGYAWDSKTLVAVPCPREDCYPGRAYTAVREGRKRLALVLPEKDATFWLESRNAALGGRRPIDLLRTGHEDDALRAIDWLVARGPTPGPASPQPGPRR